MIFISDHQSSEVLQPRKEAFDFPSSLVAPEFAAILGPRLFSPSFVGGNQFSFSFDNIDHGLLMRAVRKDTDCKWLRLYIQRWLTAPVQMPDGALVKSEKGTPQGGVVTPRTQKITWHLWALWWS